MLARPLCRGGRLGFLRMKSARVSHIRVAHIAHLIATQGGEAPERLAEARWSTSSRIRYKWKDIDQQRLFFDTLAAKMGFESLEDYYNLSKDHVVKAGGAGLLRHYYHHSVALALENIYPEHKWQKWKFKTIPRNLWADIAHVRSFVVAVSEALSISKLEGWYNVSTAQVVSLGGETLLHREGTLVALLRKVYPDHVFMEWKFRQVPRSWWSSRENRLTFFKWLETVLGISSQEDWYKQTSESVLQIDDASTMIANYYSNSLIAMLRDLRPQDTWLEWKFKQAPSNFWDSIENQRKFMEHASEALGLSSVQDWQSVTTKQLVSVGGARILKGYQYSMLSLLQHVYPSIEWAALKSFKPQGTGDSTTAPE